MPIPLLILTLGGKVSPISSWNIPPRNPPPDLGVLLYLILVYEDPLSPLGTLHLPQQPPCLVGPVKIPYPRMLTFPLLPLLPLLILILPPLLPLHLPLSSHPPLPTIPPYAFITIIMPRAFHPKT